MFQVCHFLKSKEWEEPKVCLSWWVTLTFFRGSGGGLDRERLLNNWLHILPCSSWYLLMVEWCTMIRWGFWPFLKHEKMYWGENQQRQAEGDRRRDDFSVYGHQSVHPQIFPSVALVYSWRLFICCRLMQLKSHYVWMDTVPFCRAARQIWVTPAGCWSFKINSGVSCYQNLESHHSWSDNHSAFKDHLHTAKPITTEIACILWEHNSYRKTLATEA